MTTFQFDTSGYVYLPQEVEVRPGVRSKGIAYDDLSPFVQGYVEAMFATSKHPEDPWDGYGLRRPVRAGKAVTSSIIAWMPLAFSDLARETLARIMEDCQRYQADAPRLHAEEDGKRFWAVRNDPEGCEDFPPHTGYLGDDGNVYLREGDRP